MSECVRTELTGTLELPLPPAQAYEHLTLSGQQSWMPSWWAPEYPAPVRDEMEPGTVCLIRNGSGGRSLWIATAREPGRRLAFALVRDDDAVGTLAIDLTPGPAGTVATLTFVYTGLDEAGAAAAARLAAAFETMLVTEQDWITTALTPDTRPGGVAGTGGSVRTELAFDLHVPLLPDLAYDRLTPSGQRTWMPSWWDPQFPAPAEDEMTPGTVFTARNGSGGRTLWIVTGREPARRQTYALVRDDDVAGTLDVTLAPAPGGTLATLTYVWTGLDPAGAAVVEELAAGTDRIRALEQEFLTAGLS